MIVDENATEFTVALAVTVPSPRPRLSVKVADEVLVPAVMVTELGLTDDSALELSEIVTLEASVARFPF